MYSKLNYIRFPEKIKSSNTASCAPTAETAPPELDRMHYANTTLEFRSRLEPIGFTHILPLNNRASTIVAEN